MFTAIAEAGPAARIFRVGGDKMIAFVYSSRRDNLIFRVGVMSADGTFIKDLVPFGELGWFGVVDPMSLPWSPDGRGIAYTSDGCEPLSGINCDVRSVN